MTQEIQFKEVSRTQRKYGWSVEYNDTEIVRFAEAPSASLHTLPNGTPQGEPCLLLNTAQGKLKLQIGDWLTKDQEGNLGVRSA